MADPKNVDKSQEGEPLDYVEPNIAMATTETSNIAESVKSNKSHHVSSTSERQVKFERAQKALENAALVSKRIKEHRKATAELLGKPFEDDDIGETAEMVSTVSERTGYSVATDTSTTLSVQDALNIPGISESLANTLKQKEILMERIKQYKEISKRPMKSSIIKKDSIINPKLEIRKTSMSSDTSQFINTLKEKENFLSVMQIKMKAMENTILDLTEKINEKDQIIESKNMATTLMSDSLSKKEKDSFLLLEDTRHQMIKMQENFICMETEWKEERQRLLKEIETKEEKVKNLEEANTILENSRFEVSVTNTKLIEEIELKNQEISKLQGNIKLISQENIDKEESKELKNQEILMLQDTIKILSQRNIEEEESKALKNQEILNLQDTIKLLSQDNFKEKESIENKKEFEREEKGSLEISQMIELTKKIELLEQVNCQIRQTNIELENKLVNITTESKTPCISSPNKKASPLPIRKGGRNTASKMKSPWSNLTSESSQPDTEKKTNKNEVAKFEMIVQSLNKDILDKEYALSHKDDLIAELQSTITLMETTIADLKSLQVKSSNMVDIGTEMVHFVANKVEEPITKQITGLSDDTLETHIEKQEADSKNITVLEEKLNVALQQINSLNEEIELANKNMIKIKSTHKLKLKQMQKTIDNFSKTSDANAEIVKLNEELHQLSQKVAELEEEKGNLQLHLVDYDSGRLTESDVYKKMMEMENLAETRLKVISVLETQKFELVQDLHILQQKNVEMEDKLADMSQLHNEQVCTEIKSVQLEEQIDELTASRKELELIIENLKLDKEQLHSTIKVIEEQKEEMAQKLESYIHENMALTDKLEKLSAEKVSSAESIEIVESLTTQEKLELEEYNKGMMDNKEELTAKNDNENSIENLMYQVSELNKKIELFTQERQEVMDKMYTINIENENLHDEINRLTAHSLTYQNNIDVLNQDKHELQSLNDDLSRQIEELKHERLEIIKETAEVAKPMSVEETLEGSIDMQQDDKGSGEKGVNRNKSAKQLTKEILKLKNTIKEREAEIGDCQMKILSLEEQQQKQNELMQTNACYEAKLKLLTGENQLLKDKLGKDKDTEDNLEQLKQSNELLEEELRKIRQEYTNIITVRDTRIQELENILLEYEKQIFNYGNTLQNKDKEMVEYINQITKLNDVSQKLKSTIEVLEEEKSKDQNAETIKSLNKQISTYQKKLTECEEKLKALEEEKNQLLSIKVALENKNINIETEINKLQEQFIEKQNLVKEFQSLQQKHSEEVSNVKLQAKERDEEIHEIKLQLRKESIENEKLRTLLLEKDKTIQEYSNLIEETKQQIISVSNDKMQLSEQFATAETKNKELMEKLKKFAATIKKKSSLYVELENQYLEVQKQLESRNEYLDQLTIQVDTLPTLQEKLKHAEEEVNRFQTQKVAIEQKASQEVEQLREEVTKFNDALNVARKELHFAQEDNTKLKMQVDSLNKKLVEHEIEQKNNINFTTKISTLEADLSQKQAHIVDLSQKVESQEQLLNQLQFGHDAKVQERDLYIESLETEISKYKSRICRLEESISIMEDRRHSLERKADQLDSQLQEKQKAYSEYTSQEDELINRLAVLIDHDRVVEKQIHEIEVENRQLQDKIHHIAEENQRLHKSISDMQEHYNNLIDKANRAEAAESDVLKCQTQLRDLENLHKRITQDHQAMIAKKKQDIIELESEFNTQIENAFKEKKILSEKYEKILEHVNQLENKLHEYRYENERVKINMEELNRLNQELLDKSVSNEQPVAPDYTDQYISEINKLNSLLNNKNQEVYELNGKLQTIQMNGVAAVSNLESKINDLTSKLQQSTNDVDQLITEINRLKEDHNQLQELLLHKDEQIKELKDKKTVTFEMNIPKTEGMIISSTIEALNFETPNKFDVSDLESQIVTEDSLANPECQQPRGKAIESVQKSSNFAHAEITEEIIVPKKAYLCYKEDDVDAVTDPFNSDEGWGLGESEDTGDVVPGLSHLNEQICQLHKQNATLKTDLDVTNIKLLKVMKKFKELKSSNEHLTSELKLSKQLSDSSFLDNAIENELRGNIQSLEKKIEELSSEILKEKREKEAIKKQNEVFNSANDKLTEMKEKMDNEIELWKFKFKEVNDKMSTLQWSEENKDLPDHKVSTSSSNVKDNLAEEEMVKLEKENDELQIIVDELTTKNNELSTLQVNLRNEIHNLNQQIQQQQQQQQNCKNCESLNNSTKELQKKNTELLSDIEVLKEKSNNFKARYNEAVQSYENLKAVNEKYSSDVESERNHMTEKFSNLESLLKTAQESESEAKIRIESLMDEIYNFKENIKLQSTHQINNQNENIFLLEKHSKLESHCLQLKQHLDESTKKLEEVQTRNQELDRKIIEYEQQLIELNSKLQNLSTEKNLLLSTVNELRSSIPSQGQERTTLQHEQQIVELNSQIQHLNTEKDKLLLTLAELSCPSVSNSESERKIIEYEQQIVELSSKIEHLDTENDQLLSTVAELRSSVSSAVDQRGFEIAELWKQHLAQREADFVKTEQELRAELSASEAKYEQLLDNIQSSSQEETEKLIMMEQVNSLQNKMQDKEEHLRNLQDKYSEVINQLDIMRSELEDEKVMYENKLLAQQEEYEKLIKELNLKNQELTELYQSDFKNIQNELMTSKARNHELIKEVEQLNKNIEQLEVTIIDLNNQLKANESEIYQKTNEFTITLAQRNEEFDNVRKHLLEYEKRTEDLTYEKEAELAVLRLKMHDHTKSYENLQTELNAEKSGLTEALNSKIIECTNLNKQIAGLNKALEEFASESAEKQTALENQELEIVTLKDEIFSLQQALKKSASKIEKHVTFASDTKVSAEGEPTDELTNKELLDAVPRAELDLALYMLHQRDVRCEELTMELTHLLDERDTLQLRLSDSLRSNEDMKSKIKLSDMDMSPESHETGPELPSFSIEKESLFVDTHRGQSSRSSSLSDFDPEKPKLQAKLTELRSVRHSRDVRFRQESEQRQMDLRLLQRDVANLPPEAVEQLAQAHHTLSRDSQSTSTVLLNWLRGKSTPKVVHM